MNATQQLHRRLIDELAEPAARGSRNHDPHATLRCVALGHDGTAGRAAQRARRDRRRLPTTRRLCEVLEALQLCAEWPDLHGSKWRGWSSSFT